MAAGVGIAGVPVSALLLDLPAATDPREARLLNALRAIAARPEGGDGGAGGVECCTGWNSGCGATAGGAGASAGRARGADPGGCDRGGDRVGRW